MASRRRGREHMALVERVAAHRILNWFRSPTYRGQHALRVAQCIRMQCKARRYLAWKRVNNRIEVERQLEIQKMLHTVGVKGAMQHARTIQRHYHAHRNTLRAKLSVFEGQAAAFPAALRAPVLNSTGAGRMLSVAVQTENREKFVRRDMAITLGALPGAAEAPHVLSPSRTRWRPRWRRCCARRCL